MNGTDLADQPMCTGPFRFVEYVKGQFLVVQPQSGTPLGGTACVRAPFVAKMERNGCRPAPHS